MAEAKVLRLLRYDAARWWYHCTLRYQGAIDKARILEREQIRSNVRFIRENIGRNAVTYRIDVIQFPDRPVRKPFDLKPITSYGGESYTVSCSNVAVGMFAAWIYCYANRIGWRPKAKAYDYV